MIEYGFGFWLKKSISAVLMPLPVGLLTGFLGLWYLFRGHYAKAKTIVTVSLLWIALFSYAPIVDVMTEPLEESYERLTDEQIMGYKDVKYILLLGGDAQHRAWEALRIHRLLPETKIIASGYRGGAVVSDANVSAELLLDGGVERKSVRINDKPKDTYEEALAVAKMIGKERFFLVTSGYHMRRAKRFFDDAGLNPIAAPADSSNGGCASPWEAPNARELTKSEHAWHEYLGLLWSRIRCVF